MGVHDDHGHDGHVREDGHADALDELDELDDGAADEGAEGDGNY